MPIWAPCSSSRTTGLDLAGSRKASGRPLYDDLRQGKRTLFVIRALVTLAENGRGDERRELLAILSNKEQTEKETLRCLEILRNARSQDQVEEEIDRRARRLVRQVGELDLTDDLLEGSLASLIDYVRGYG